MFGVLLLTAMVGQSLKVVKAWLYQAAKLVENSFKATLNICDIWPMMSCL